MVKLNKIIGTKASFGIEYIKPLKEAGSLLAVRLWVNQVPIGTLDDKTYLPSFQYQLKQLVNPKIVLPEGTQVIEDDNSLISLGDTFDDFVIHRFVFGDNLMISLRLIDTPFFSHPLLKCGVTYRELVSLQFAQTVVSQFNQTISR